MTDWLFLPSFYAASLDDDTAYRLLHIPPKCEDFLTGNLNVTVFLYISYDNTPWYDTPICLQMIFKGFIANYFCKSSLIARAYPSFSIKKPFPEAFKNLIGIFFFHILLKTFIFFTGNYFLTIYKPKSDWTILFYQFRQFKYL